MSVTQPTPLNLTAPATSGGTETPPIPDDVRAFAERRGLGDYIARTARMLRAAFPQSRQIEVFLFTDPEWESEPPVQWVVVRVRAIGSATELSQSYQRFMDLWVTATPASIRDLLHGSYTPA
jgi:hypothetical protein